MSTSTESPSRSPVTVEQWAAMAVHTVTLPSGAVVKVKIPDIGRLLRAGDLPEHLSAVALGQVFAEIDQAPADVPQEEKARKRLEVVNAMAELVDRLVLEMVVEPTLTAAMLDEIPAEDKEMLAALAQRDRATDALGKPLGVSPLAEWAGFRDRPDNGGTGGADGAERAPAAPDVGSV